MMEAAEMSMLVVEDQVEDSPWMGGVGLYMYLMASCVSFHPKWAGHLIPRRVVHDSGASSGVR
jgi:hypothetical protein